MIEQITINDLDEATAVQQLRTLEQSALDGNPVTPSQLAEARERVTLAGLRARGREARAAKQREADRIKAQEEAKVNAKALLKGGADSTLEDAKTALTAAVRAFVTAVEQSNTRVQTAAELLASAGLPSPYFGQIDPFDLPGMDTKNYSRIEYGEVLYVCLDGEINRVLKPKNVVPEALSDAVRGIGIGRVVKIEQ